jgi:hypothetical protein
MVARDPLRYRRQILALKQALSKLGCTVLFLDDQTGEIPPATSIFALRLLSPPNTP